MNAIAPLIDDMFKVESEELTLNEEATKWMKN
jgi:hypothetical protein